MTDLPESWIECQLSDVAAINPPLDRCPFPQNAEVHFVPMPSVEAETGKIDISLTRPHDAVKKGYTAFIAGDVLFAKITPCMENGKMALVPDLPHSVAFGSTEFHVLRSTDGAVPKYIYYFVSGQAFRYEAEHNMTGAVGQKRVPTTFVTDHVFPLPPLNEQHRIVAKIEELFSELDSGVESLTLARAQLKTYRQALLKHAFEGKLTADWRKANLDKLEAPEALLNRIRKEREARYKLAWDDWQERLSEWRGGGEVGRKPNMPRRPVDAEQIEPDELADLPKLPEGWSYRRFAEFVDGFTAGNSFACEEREPRKDEIGVAKVSAVSWGEYDETESKTCKDPDREDPDLFIRAGDFLLSRANTIELVGACVIVRHVSKRIMLSDKTLRLGFGAGNSAYFLQYLRSLTGRAEIEKRSSGNQESMRNIGQDRIRSIIVPICCEDESAQVMEILDAQLSAVTLIDSEISVALAKSNALRQSVLKKAFSGELVAQDPADEPGSALLARLKGQPVTTKPRRGRKAAA